MEDTWSQGRTTSTDLGRRFRLRPKENVHFWEISALRIRTVSICLGPVLLMSDLESGDRALLVEFLVGVLLR